MTLFLYFIEKIERAYSMFSHILALCTATIWFIAANIFVRLVFIHNVELVPSRKIFSAIFAISGLLFTTLSSKVLDFGFLPDSEYVLSIMFGTLMVLGVVLAPLLMMCSVLRDLGIKAPIVGGTLSLLCLISFIWFVYKRHNSMWDALLTQVMTFGFAFMGLLNGFAAASTPYKQLYPIISAARLKASKTLCITLDKRQHYLLDAWGKVKRKLAVSNYASQGQSKGIFTWLKSGLSSQTAECDGFDRMSLTMFLEIDELSQQAEYNSEHWTHIATAALGVILSIFAITKILVTCFTLATFAFIKDSSDVLQRHENTSKFEKTKALVVVANVAMVLMGLRGFLVTAFRLSTTYMAAISANTTILFFSVCGACYTFTLIGIFGMSLSDDHRSIIMQAMGVVSLDGLLIFRDSVFVVACFASTTLHTVSFNSQDQ
eukprot:Tbor_TRINITY_DN4695_c0_g1::TRINITY_DN4695_c0_g1_i2::g.14904::m.14904